jgi:hypothetical protein
LTTATDPRTSPGTDPLATIWLDTTSAAVGAMSHVTGRGIWLVPGRSSERISKNRRATTKLPDRTVAPAGFGSGTDSLVSSDSSTSKPSLVTQLAEHPGVPGHLVLPPVPDHGGLGAL